MPIKSIRIKYYKSFKDCKVLLKDVNIIIGENGSGKSNFIEAIDYFYQNLTETHLSDTIFDENNRYSNFVRIGVSYDLSRLQAIAKSKRNMSEEGKDVPYLSFFEKILFFLLPTDGNISITYNLTFLVNNLLIEPISAFCTRQRRGLCK